MHGALENTTSAQQLPDGRYVCVYRPPGWRERQHTKYKVTKKVHKWRVEVCVPSLVGHSLGSFYGLFKAVVQTKQFPLLLPWHPQRPGQRVGKMKVYSQLYSKERLLLHGESSAADLGASSPGHLPKPISDGKPSHTGISLHMQGCGGSRNGVETLSQGTDKDRAGHSCAWTVFSPNPGQGGCIWKRWRERVVFLITPAFVLMPTQPLLKLGITFPLEGRWPRGKG